MIKPSINNNNKSRNINYKWLKLIWQQESIWKGGKEREEDGEINLGNSSAECQRRIVQKQVSEGVVVPSQQHRISHIELHGGGGSILIASSIRQSGNTGAKEAFPWAFTGRQSSWFCFPFLLFIHPLLGSTFFPRGHNLSSLFKYSIWLFWENPKSILLCVVTPSLTATPPETSL